MAVDSSDDDNNDNLNEEEDEIVREIDVFLSLSPEGSEVYLMQFPLQHQELAHAESARIKPHHNLMELSHGTPADIQEFGQYHMPTRTFASHTVPVSTHLALGMISNEPGVEGLHLIPLSHIIQMRPSFHHVDEATINTASTTAEEDAKRERAEAAKLERKPLSFQKKESERAAIARKSSYGYKKGSEEGEPWQSLEVHHDGSMASLDYTSRIICSSPETDLHIFVGKDLGAATTNNAYVHSLNYLPSSSDNKNSNSNSLNNNNAKGSETMDVGAVCTRLVGLLHKGMPTPFSLLRRHFPPSVPDETMLVALGSCAFLIRGNLILQSRLLPLAPAISQARTMILLILQTMGVVYRSRLEAMYKQQNEDEDDETSTGSLGHVSSEALLMLLEQVAQKTQDGWKLKVDDDVSFAERFPETVLMHLKFWGDEVQRCGALLDRYRSADI
jgi:hypothetical protein